MNDSEKTETAHDEYDAMRAARALTAKSGAWLDRVLVTLTIEEEGKSGPEERSEKK